MLQTTADGNLYANLALQSGCFSKARVIRILHHQHHHHSLTPHTTTAQCGSGHKERETLTIYLKLTLNRIASVAGTAEPEYGPEAFQSVIARSKGKNPVSELTPEDYEWTLPEQSHVETSTFYITADTGHAVMCQIIHSKVKYSPVTSMTRSDFECI